MIEGLGVAKQVKVAVDAMGGDNAPGVVLEGCARALAADADLSLYLCGTPSVVEAFAREHERVIPQPASEIIGMGEHPAHAVRQKKDSSIVVGCRLVKDGDADGFFSAGSTGACLAAATLTIGRIKSVKRPALGVVIPAQERPVMLLDVGANADCKAAYIAQFAHMGVSYMEAVMGVSNASVGLLNIGEEETKGSSLALDSYTLLAQSVPQFKGNCEGKDLLQGAFDVVVTDGFTGNVCLKTIEGTSKLLFTYLKEAFTSDLVAKVGAMLLMPKVKALKDRVDPDRFGGSPLLGINGACVIGHGSSNALAIENGIRATAEYVRADVTSKIAHSLAEQEQTSKDAL